MSRAWPFEDVKEGGGERGRHHTPQELVAECGEGTEAVIVRIGLNDAQLVLVDPNGAWDRWVYHSMEEAQEVAESLGIPVHVGEYPEELRVRMNARQRSVRDFDRGPYPEQGRVGPVINYPEGRPRLLDRPDSAGSSES